MSIDARKRQKKLEKQKAKKKAEQKAIARRESGGVPARLQAAAKAPILHCCQMAALWQAGIGNVLVSRELKSGNVAFATFLVDVSCLGVKGVFFNVVPRAIYDGKVYEKLLEQGPLKHLRPEEARKLVEGAVEYARRFGLEPHPDYRVGKLIFGDVAADECTQEFVYGKNGMPYFFAGPHDGPDRCHFVMRALEQSCGPGGYHYTIPVASPDELDFIEGPLDG